MSQMLLIQKTCMHKTHACTKHTHTHAQNTLTHAHTQEERSVQWKYLIPIILTSSLGKFKTLGVRLQSPNIFEICKIKINCMNTFMLEVDSSVYKEATFYVGSPRHNSHHARDLIEISWFVFLKHTKESPLWRWAAICLRFHWGTVFCCWSFVTSFCPL